MTDFTTLKLLLIGNSSSGKSSLLLRFTDSIWVPEDTQATIGVDFKTKLLNINNQKVKLTIWDTAGQERFRTLTSSYYRGCQGVLIVFDVTTRSSFDQIPKWFDELTSHISSSEIVAYVVGNKTDRPGRVVTQEEGEAIAQKVGASAYFEASAKDGTGVRELFLTLTQEVLAKQSTLHPEGDQVDGVDLGNADSSSSSCAC